MLVWGYPHHHHNQRPVFQKMKDGTQRGDGKGGPHVLSFADSFVTTRQPRYMREELVPAIS